MSVSLKLILFFSLLSFLEAKRLKALEVKNVYCKDCQKLESGMIQNYFLSDYTNMSRNELTDIYNKVQLEPQSRKNYSYFLYPILVDATWEDFAVEINQADQVKLFQKRQRFGDKPYCFNKKQKLMNSFKNIRDESFLISHYLVLNSTHVTDIKDACGDLKLYPLSKASKKLKSKDIEPCFKNKNIRCVYDISHRKVDQVDQKQRKRPFLVYSRYNIIFWAAHLENEEGERYAYYLYDKENKKDYWIDDDIKYSANKEKALDRGVVVPLIEPHDPFFDLMHQKGKKVTPEVVELITTKIPLKLDVGGGTGHSGVVLESAKIEKH